MVSRVDEGWFARWWWTVDRVLLAAMLALIATGVVLSLAASPAVAERIGLTSFHFVNRQVFFAALATIVLLVLSFLSPVGVRRVALLTFVGAWVLVIATLFFGAEIKGARRWLNLPGFGLQPSEFLKPAFVVMAAWAFSQGALRRDMPGTMLAMLLYVGSVIPLILQPDMGQTFLITLTWFAMFFLVGLHWLWVVGGVGSIGLGAFIAYKTVPHFAARIDKFMAPGTEDSFQVDVGLDAIASGGWFGKGPGEGTIKRIIPDSHTDFILAVTAEEFGIIACLALLLLFAFIVLRTLHHALKNGDGFTRLAACGLAILFGLQASINMAVNLHLMPAKGMTLPFISYGGSSLISLALTTGFMLALTRRRPQADALFKRG